MRTAPQTDADPHTDAVPPPRNQGLGRIIVMVYAVFALSALARSLFQILSHFDRAPVAYVLDFLAIPAADAASMAERREIVTVDLRSN